jgi:hypothetical protein
MNCCTSVTYRPLEELANDQHACSTFTCLSGTRFSYTSILVARLELEYVGMSVRGIRLWTARLRERSIKTSVGCALVFTTFHCTASLQTAEMATSTIERSKIEGLPTFRLKSEAIADGRYKVKGAKEVGLYSETAKREDELWFKSPVCIPIT